MIDRMVKAGASLPVIEGDLCCPSVVESPLEEDQAAELARGFAALADAARLQILSILATSPAGEVCVCEFVGPLGRSQPTVSHHLKVLGDAGLVEGDRRGKWVWYRLVPERLARLRGALGRR
ncbi:MAG TPA: metalloregulator ArsR/SmtB family transcription factor [Acidimicrobiales bacterium]|nr:metalloregulator ArsR/SmtB family transcription factor [Acidimicrobiales bacterium]